MNYEANCEARCEATCAPLPMETVGDMVRTNNSQAHEIKLMVRKIKAYLFGLKEPTEGENPAPTCLREELNLANTTQVDVLEELSKISGMLGL